MRRLTACSILGMLLMTACTGPAANHPNPTPSPSRSDCLSKAEVAKALTFVVSGAFAGGVIAEPICAGKYTLTSAAYERSGDAFWVVLTRAGNSYAAESYSVFADNCPMARQKYPKPIADKMCSIGGT